MFKNKCEIDVINRLLGVCIINFIIDTKRFRTFNYFVEQLCYYAQLFTTIYYAQFMFIIHTQNVYIIKLFL